MNVPIPTISAGVSSNSRVNNGENDVLKLVQRKFKANEEVVVILETYEISYDERFPRILALVVSHQGGTYCVFSMEVSHNPPRHTNDVTIQQVFAIDSSFKIKRNVLRLNFELCCLDENPTVFYYSEETSAMQFEAKIVYVMKSVDLEQLNPANKSGNCPLNLSWIDDYRKLGDMKHELKRREHEYIVFNDFTVYCATWNVNNKLNYFDPLPEWLSAYNKPDIYAIALQELDTTTRAAALFEDKCNMLWIERMFCNIPSRDEYEELKSVRLVGMMLTIIVRRDLRDRANISRCQIKSIPHGVFKSIGGLKPLGNKGGVAVSLQLNEDKICFVNSHLAPHLKAIKERNDDYSYIVQNLTFENGIKLEDHDHIFWIGDLNYRIDEPPGISLPFDNFDLETYTFLVQHDQLIKEMRNLNCFRGYQEGAIEFRPTYKYDTGTDNYDSSEKQRTPAYCDRVLWKGKRINQLCYSSVMEIRESDHKPVYAVFRVKIKTKDEMKYKRVREELIKLVDKHENENQPQLLLDVNTIDFGLVRFNEPAVRDFNVSNICPMLVKFKFNEKPNSMRFCERWLRVQPSEGNLLTDTTKSIRVSLKISRRTVREFLDKFSISTDPFYFDILIFNVVDGKHNFISIAGQYKPSCFGLSIETLCRTDRPLSEYTQSEFKQLLLNKSERFRATMPREIYMLIDHLFKIGSTAQGIFSNFQSNLSNSIEFMAVRDWLDAWSDDEFPGTPQSAAEALIMLLDLPQKPLLYPLVDELLATKSSDAAMECISKLSSPKRNVFVHLCLFLRDGIEKDFYNLQDIACFFGTILLRSNQADLSNIFMLRILSSDMGAVSLATKQIRNDIPSNQDNARATSNNDLLN